MAGRRHLAVVVRGYSEVEERRGPTPNEKVIRAAVWRPCAIDHLTGNGLSRDRPGFLQSWQHSTIAKRVTFLERLIADPAVEATFQRRVLWLKCGLLVLLGIALALLLPA